MACTAMPSRVDSRRDPMSRTADLKCYRAVDEDPGFERGRLSRFRMIDRYTIARMMPG